MTGIGLMIVFVLLSLVAIAVCAPMLAKAREVSREGTGEAETPATDAPAEAAAPTEETPTPTDAAPEPTELEKAQAEIEVLRRQLAEADDTVTRQAQMLIERHEEITDLQSKLNADKAFALPAPAAPTEGEIPGCVKGRVVYYTPIEDEHYVATAEEPIVGLLVKVWDKVTGRANIQLFPDGESENPQGLLPRVTSRLYNADGAPGTWRFTR